MHGQLTEWAQDIANVLTQPPGEPQLQALTSWLQRLSFTDHFALFIHGGLHPPMAVFDTFPAELRAAFMDDYRAGP